MDRNNGSVKSVKRKAYVTQPNAIIVKNRDLPKECKSVVESIEASKENSKEQMMLKDLARRTALRECKEKLQIFSINASLHIAEELCHYRLS